VIRSIFLLLLLQCEFIRSLRAAALGGADGEEVAPLEGDFLAEDRVGVGAVAVLSSL
jgi:hypothetical protein|tara:strand:+ start:1034 stop:1204 length:171 start_codon:yes stop_codon:yes gene_type:complete